MRSVIDELRRCRMAFGGECLRDVPCFDKDLSGQRQTSCEEEEAAIFTTYDGQLIYFVCVEYRGYLIFIEMKEFYRSAPSIFHNGDRLPTKDSLESKNMYKWHIRHLFSSPSNVSRVRSVQELWFLFRVMDGHDLD
jgi:hypothetical protein